MVRMFRFAPIVGTLLAVLVLSTAAIAQQGPDRGPPEGGRPPGGPPPGSPGMFGGPGGGSLASMYGRLLRSPTMQKELGITEAQKARIDEVSQKARDGMRELFSGMRDLSEDQRQAKSAEIAKQMQARMEENSKAMESILQPSQFQRLRGIALQAAGIQAFADKQLQKDLKLSEDQILEINLINENVGKEMRTLFSSRGDREKMREKMTKSARLLRKRLSTNSAPNRKPRSTSLRGPNWTSPCRNFVPAVLVAGVVRPMAPPPDSPPRDGRGDRPRNPRSNDR